MSEPTSSILVASPEAPRASDTGRLWTGVLAGPVAWLLNLLLSYLLTDWSCNHGHAVVIHLVNVVTLLAALAGTVVAWSAWRMAEPSKSTGAAPPPGRVRFMALAGLILGIVFALAIVAQAIPPFILGPCQR